MSYYTGQGDYYSGKGDPGLFGSIFSGIKGAVGGFLRGGPMGAVTGGLRGVLGRQQTPIGPPAPGAPRIAPMPSMLPTTRGTMAMAPAPRAAGPAVCPPSGNGCGPGYHLNKSYSYARGAEAGTMCVRNRRMNPGNAKALRRAIRREKAFIGLARTALRGTGYKISRTASYARKK